jgi:predicted phosphodiesterase
MGTEGLTVTWLPPDPVPDGAFLTLLSEGRELGRLPVERTDQVAYARLPAEIPWQQGNVSYLLPGEGEVPIEIKVRSPGENLRLTLITDSHVHIDENEGRKVKMHRRAMERAALFNSHLIGLGGDLVHDGTSCTEWITFYEVADPTLRHIPVIAARGNHEEEVPWGKAACGRWSEFFPGCPEHGYYQVVVGPLKIIVLNSNFVDHKGLRRAEQEFFEAAMKERSPFTLVMVHHPVYPLKRRKTWWSHAVSFFQAKKNATLLRKHFGPLFKKYQPDVVFSGHEHIYYRRKVGGVTYVGGGRAGGESKKPKKYRTVQEDLDGVTFEPTITFLDVNKKFLLLNTENLKGKKTRSLDRVVLPCKEF